LEDLGAYRRIILKWTSKNPVGMRTGFHWLRLEPFVPEPSISDVEVATGKLKWYKLPGADQIPAELIQAVGGGHYILRSTNLLS
jgi:hypothetical protein